MAALAVVLAACSTAPEPSPTTAAVFRLPVAALQVACRGVGLEARLAGSPVDPRIAWLEPGGHRLVWPAGFMARFTPTLEILDPDGQLVLEEGEAVSGACLMGSADDPGRIMMIEGPKRYEHTGEYLTIQPPERLEFTWISEATDHRPTVVTVEFLERDRGTDLVLTHRRLPATQVESHRSGWTDILQLLERLSEIPKGGARW